MAYSVSVTVNLAKYRFYGPKHSLNVIKIYRKNHRRGAGVCWSVSLVLITLDQSLNRD